MARFNPKIIYLILGVVILVEVFFGLKVLTRSTPPPPAKLQPLSGAEIILVSPKKEYKVGDNIPVSVRVSTGGHPSDGTDLILRYDPTLVEATISALRRGRIYPEYPVTEVDSKSGVIRMSGIASTSVGGFNGVGVFATLNLKAKQAGKTTLMVDFKKGETTDTNVVEAKTATDLLEEVSDLELTIK